MGVSDQFTGWDRGAGGNFECATGADRSSVTSTGHQRFGSTGVWRDLSDVVINMGWNRLSMVVTDDNRLGSIRHFGNGSVLAVGGSCA